MSILEYIVDERYELLANALVAGIGFFLALFANRLVEEWKERRSFAFTLRAIQAEAKSNVIDFNESFTRYFRKEIVLRKFGTTTVSTALADSLFVKHATAFQLETITEYLRNISLSNSYREMAEKLRFNDAYFSNKSERSIKRWEPGLVQAWEDNLVKCEKCFAAVQSLN
jgi:hypothetical protein